VIRTTAPIIVSVIVLIMFGSVSMLVLTRGLYPGSEPVALMLVGGLIGMVGQVGNYWLGSSAGSKEKDQTIKEQAAKSLETQGKLI
jgi:hypothetical protein